MPRFSLIVPVYMVQAYLRPCLDSILDQSFGDLEVIAVDDCSPDSSGAILDEYAGRDSRVRVTHLPENVGLGLARNAGVRRATGDYLFFLDSDDTLTAGALQALAHRLATTGDPDILLFDYVRTYWWGRGKPSRAGARLGAAGDDVFTVSERPEYLHLLHVVWNRIFRRGFYARHGLEFTAGFYEDVPLTYAAMLSASSIACLDRVCVEYRQRRQGSIVRTPGRRHFDIFDQYRRLFEFIDGAPELDAMRPVVFDRMVTHYLYTFALNARIEHRDRAEYFRLSRLHYRTYKPSGFTRPPGRAGLKYLLLEHGVYPLFQAAKHANRAHRWLRSRVRRLRTAAGRRVYAAIYRFWRSRPIDPGLAVYSSYWGRGVSCNPAAVYAKAGELAPHVHGVWVITKGNERNVPPGVDYVVLNRPRYWKVIARAKYLVNNVNFSDTVVKREGQVHLQTQHGTPLKKLGVDMLGHAAAAKSMNFARLLSRSDRWDYSISPNQHSTELFEWAYPCGFTTLSTGYPRNDVYYTATARDVLDIRTRLGIADGQTLILFAPTMRDYQRSFTPLLDLRNLARALGRDFLLLVRAHHAYGNDRQLQQLHEQGLLVDVSSHPSTEELCLASDMLLTDYSSIMFDYANLDRPIVIYAPDWAAYTAQRGVYFDLLSGRLEETPGATVTTEAELVEVLRSGRWDSERSQRLRHAFRERFCQWDDGHAAERVVRRLMLGEEPHPPIAALDARTTAPSPRQALGQPRRVRASLLPQQVDGDMPSPTSHVTGNGARQPAR